MFVAVGTERRVTVVGFGANWLVPSELDFEFYMGFGTRKINASPKIVQDVDNCINV